MVWFKSMPASGSTHLSGAARRMLLAAAAVWSAGVCVAVILALASPPGMTGFALPPQPSGNWTVALPLAANLALLIVGLFIAGLGWARPQSQEYRLLAASTLLWAIFGLQYVWPMPEFGPWRAAHQLFIQWLPVPWLNVLIGIFMLHILAPNARPMWMLLPLQAYGAIFTLAATVISVSGWQTEGGLSLPVVVYSVVGVASVLVLGAAAARQGGRTFGVIALAMGLSSVAGTHDLLVRSAVLAPNTPHLIPYTGLVLLASFSLVLMQRYLAAIKAEEEAHERLNAELSRQLALRESQLREEHARRLALERERAHHLERERLLRDLHDGVGGTLVTTLMRAEQGDIDDAGLTKVLREAVDDIRALMDSCDPLDAAWGAMLAGLRERVAGRWTHRGPSLHWHVEHAAETLHLTPETGLQLVRWIQEALNNAICHASARRVTVEVRVEAGLDGASSTRVLALRVADDGLGCVREVALRNGGRGLRNLEARAKAVQARHKWDSEPGHGTRVELCLPLPSPTRLEA